MLVVNIPKCLLAKHAADVWYFEENDCIATVAHCVAHAPHKIGRRIDVLEGVPTQDHGENLVAKYPDARDQSVWFNPEAQGRLLFPRSRLIMEYLQILHRVPLPWKERMLCYGHLLWRMLRHPRALLLWDFFKLRRGRSLKPS